MFRSRVMSVFGTNAHALAGRTLICALVLATSAAEAQMPQSYVVTIDASTTQPVGTGFIPPDSNGEVIVFAEGALRVQNNPDRFDDGWFGPAGKVNWVGVNKPITNGMPYGSLVGGCGSVLANYQYLGRMGSFDLQPGDVGNEMRLALNLSDSDLASLQGEVTIVLIYLPEGSADVSQVVIRHDTALPAPTGLLAEAGDHFVVLPYGALRDPSLPNSFYTNGHFGPEGLLGLIGALQPYPDGPYGALYGTFQGAAGAFEIGDGGSWSAQISDQGLEFQLLLNADAASQAGMVGKFVVNVVRVPDPGVSGIPDGQDASEGSADGSAAGILGAFPNPMTAETTIRFRLAEDDQVRLRVYDAQGRWVRKLLDQPEAAGVHAMAWDGRDDSGSRLAAGTYFYQLSTSVGSQTGRVVLVD